MKQIIFGMFMLSAATCAGSAVAAENFPSKPLRFLVGFAPGGGTDTMARTVAAKLSDSLGQQVIVDNRPGANANLAAGIAAHAVPDGHTVLFISVSHAISKSLYTNLDYDLQRDFAPLINIAAVPMFVVVNPKSPQKTLAELIASAKSGAINYASAGDGSPEHIAAELLKSAAKINMTQVPYKGGGPSAVALIAGEIQLGFNTAPVAVPYIKSGRMRALAVTSAKRNPALPDVPTIDEAGVKGYDMIVWYGAIVPKGTPTTVINRLNADINKALLLPDVRERLARLGADPLGGTAKSFGDYINSEIVKYARVVREGGLKQR